MSENWRTAGPRWHLWVLRGTLAWIVVAPGGLLVAYLAWWKP